MPTKSPTPDQNAVSGFGATKKAWLAAHREAPDASGYAYLPIVQTYEGPYPLYGGVLLESPVVSYSLNLPKGTSLEEAKEYALAEFPPGARFVKFDDDQAACLIGQIQSSPVRKSLDQQGYSGAPFGALFSTHTGDTSELDPRRVTNVTMTVLFPDSATDFGRC